MVDFVRRRDFDIQQGETRVHLGIKSQKSSYLNQRNVSKPVVVFMSQKREDLRIYNLHRGLEIGKSQPRSKVGNFECMSWLNCHSFSLSGEKLNAMMT
jgi:hypothetical protein